jgi:hypothetical protein
MASGKTSSPVTTSPNCTPCLKDVVGRGDEVKSQEFTHGQGTDFDKVGTLS